MNVKELKSNTEIKFGMGVKQHPLLPTGGAVAREKVEPKMIRGVL